ncbi:ATP-binding protein [Oryzomonas rubra]|uniref:histidine kinase n=1 Tax=Oryzomonas rubra TaxID=2509454 RepID=A0A5A9X7D8_9BACT|nr:ATP-binding protein [Oryzomonas rubra]KAA0888368.1 HAMP domain-containing protein [Oryzomonas rubra]
MRNTVFIKIFLWFWLCIITIIGAVAVIVVMHLGGLHGSEWRRLAEKSLSLHGATAVKIYEQNGKDALIEFARPWEDKAPDTVLLFQGVTELTGRRVPQQVTKLVDKASRIERTDTLTLGEVTFIARRIVGQNNTPYIFVVETNRKGYFKQLSELPRFIVVKVISVFIFSVLFCFALSYSFTSSIRKLRSATHRLANGDLSSRVLPTLGKRNDELSDLAMDFDQMAERIDELVTSQKKLLADISHELRSPLARLSIALDLCHDKTGEPLQKQLSRIERECHRLNELIGQLLDLSRFESRITEMQPVPVDLTSLVNLLVEDADFEARSRGCHVRMVASEPCSVSGIPDHLRSAIENVIRNALRFTHEGTDVEVSITCLPPESKAILQVRDHGDGVSEADLFKIFKPFYRVEDSRDRRNGGTGLGLAITERIINLHGGSVRAYNAVNGNGGLIVEITIPCDVI